MRILRRLDAPVIHLAQKKAGIVEAGGEPAAGASYGIQGIPTFVLFKNGREAARRSGAMPKQAFVSWLSEVEPGLFGGGQQAAR